MEGHAVELTENVSVWIIKDSHMIDNPHRIIRSIRYNKIISELILNKFALCSEEEVDDSEWLLNTLHNLSRLPIKSINVKPHNDRVISAGFLANPESWSALSFSRIMNSLWEKLTSNKLTDLPVNHYQPLGLLIKAKRSLMFEKEEATRENLRKSSCLIQLQKDGVTNFQRESSNPT